MKKGFAITLALAVVLAFAGSPQAQTTSPQEKEKPQPRPTQQREGERSGQPNWGTLISSVNNTNTEVTELQGLKDLTATNVQIVSVSDLAQGNNMEALHNALKRNEADVTKMRTALGANTVVTQQLKAKNIATGRVVALDVSPTGTVHLFVQPDTP